ncbi:MAG: DUF7507 domain-containing protein, partial [Methanosarcina sp.]
GKGPEANISKAGETINYQINITNAGNSDLTNITINDSLVNLIGPNGDNASVGILNVGETWTYSGTYTVTQQDIDNSRARDGLINNTATVDCDQLNPKSDYAEVPIEGVTAYTIDKIITDVSGNGPASYVTKAADTVSYKVNITNVGNVSLTNIAITDTLIGLTGPVGDNSPAGILDPGETWTYNGIYNVTQQDLNSNGGGDGFIENTATVDCDQLEPKSHSAEVPLQIVPAYTIDKIITDVAERGSESPVMKAGETVSYKVNVTNAGNVDLTNITLNDSLAILVGPTGDNLPIGVLNVGETWTYNGIYNVTQTDLNTNGGGDGFIENTATVDCDQLEPKSHSAEVPLQIVPAYTIDKIIIDVAGRGQNSPVTKAGDIISYQIKVANADSVDLTNITVTDSLINLTGPTGDNFQSGVLNVGEVWVYEGNYTVT